jgi:hypothetical protein
LTQPDRTHARLQKLLQTIGPVFRLVPQPHEALHDPVATAIAFGELLKLDPNDEMDRAISLAFKAAEFDPRNPIYWKVLLGLFALTHYGEWKKEGAPVKWVPTEYDALLQDYNEVKSRKPSLKDHSIARLLKVSPPYKQRYGRLSTDRIRTLVREAKQSRTEIQVLEQVLLERRDAIFKRAGIEFSEEEKKEARASFQVAIRELSRILLGGNQR